MKLVEIEANSLLGDELEVLVDEEIKENAESMIGSHLKFLGDYWALRNTPDPNRHLCMLAVDEATNRAIAYRYFYIEQGTKHCELFATYVSAAYRRRGVAKELFHSAVERGEKEGCTHFTIRFGSPNEERAGLVEYYQRYVREQASSSKRFSIYYGGRHLEFPAQQGA
ncbi:GNAT family N-acetyltransferase [Thioalkalivibrio sp. ALMg3]|uniref:GNAT family N-acetyltransferase n=1 Tax=Thioalkalivibrio sp. ALMg3 TaxID=1158163 RepID=UPI000366E1EB|nr:GNAT family N-acetyltransferase [Thioalkalivibrio sp. ALMg3]